MFQRNHVLVLGGAGFIGSHVVDKLLAQGAKVTVFDRSHEYFRSPIVGVSYIYGEFGNRGLLADILSNDVDIVVHLISSTVPKTSNDDPIYDVQSNLIESIALLQLCREHGVKKIVFGSSGGTIYGVPKSTPISETHTLNPICSYGIVKLAIENYLYMYSQLYGIQYVVARFGNPYGERQKRGAIQGLIPVVVEKAIMGKTIEIWGDGEIIRDFVYVGDAANFVAIATLSDLQGTFNVSSGDGVSVNQIIRLVSDLLGRELPVEKLKSRGFDVPEIVLDVSKARKLAQWQAEINLAEGVKKLAGWLENIER